MAEQIKIDVTVGGIAKAQDELKTLTRQINEVKAAIETASQTDGGIISFEGSLKSTKELYSLEHKLSAELNEVKSQYYAAQKKREKDFRKFLLEEEEKSRKRELEQTKDYEKHIKGKEKLEKDFRKFLQEEDEKSRKQELEQTKAYEKYVGEARVALNRKTLAQIELDEENSRRRMWNSLKSQMEADAARKKRMNTMPLSYTEQINKLSKLQEGFFQKYQGTGIDEYFKKYNQVGIAIDNVKQKQNEFNERIKKTCAEGSTYLGSFAQKFRKMLAA